LEKFDLSVTRTNVEWGIDIGNNETIYVWLDALLNYIFAIGYYDDPEKFNKFWSNSLQICGKDNLKFQAQIFQAILLANNVPQTTELLVHGTILDENGTKMSKTLGNVIDPIEQKSKWGLSPLKYYLTFGLSTYGDSKYSERELVNLWNSDIVNKFGNLISRTLHLIDIKNVDLSTVSQDVIDRVYDRKQSLQNYVVQYDLLKIREVLNSACDLLNKKYEVERPFDKNCTNVNQILSDIYYELEQVADYYSVILKEYKVDIKNAFNNKKKAILFKSLKYE
jgi:methionyl-tRNA synthetase